MKKKLEVFIRNVYNNEEQITINGMNKHTEIVQNKIQKISKNLGIETYYIPYPSELNNLDGKWRIFLNQSNNPFKMWQEFGHLVGVYYKSILISENLDLEVPVEIPNQDNFAFYFCVPDFILNEINIPTDTNKAIIFISETFTVDKSFARERLSLYQTSN